MTPKQANPLTTVEYVQSRFFHFSTAVKTIRHVYQPRLKSPVAKGQRISSELGARTQSCSRSSSLAPNSIRSEPPPTTSRVAPRADTKRYPPLTSDVASSKTEKGHWTEEVYEKLYRIRHKTALHPLAYDDLQTRG